MNTTFRTVIFSLAVASANLAGLNPINASDWPGNEGLIRLQSPDALPPTLAETGAFSDLTTLTPAAGVVAYDVNVPFWSDGAQKRRWFCLPEPSRHIGFARDENWSFPAGTVWIKHFDLELTKGDPSSVKRLETRLLVRTGEGVFGATYRWGESLTNATLVPDTGLDESFVIRDGNTVRTQRWRYPSRYQCLRCHTAVGGFALGFNTAQLNRECPDGAVPRNQIERLNAGGYFSTNVTGLQTLRALVHPTNEAVSIEYRVRSYLAANCAQCHQPGGPARGYWDARITTPLSAAGIVEGPLMDDLENPVNRVVIPGNPSHSALIVRLWTLDYTHMPPTATSVLNTQAIALMNEWITNDLRGYRSFAQWQQEKFGSTAAEEAGPDADPDGDGASNWLEYLSGTEPQMVADHWGIGIRRAGTGVTVSFRQIANRGFEVQGTTNLANPSTWQPLDLPENRPFLSAVDRTAQVVDVTVGATNKFYRVRVYEP